MPSYAIYIILAIAAAIGLDWLWIRWRKQQNAGKPPVPAKEAENPPASVPLLSPSRLTAVLKPGSARTAVAALLISLVSQFWLTHEAALLGAIGYVIAIVLFVRALRTDIPQDFEPSAESLAELAKPKQPAVATAAVPALPQRPTPAKKPAAAKVGRTETGPIAPSFMKHWRYYTVANLVKGTPPNIPAEVLNPPLPEPEVEVVAEVAPVPATMSATPTTQVEVLASAAQTQTTVVAEPPTTTTTSVPESAPARVSVPVTDPTPASVPASISTPVVVFTPVPTSQPTVVETPVESAQVPPVAAPIPTAAPTPTVVTPPPAVPPTIGPPVPVAAPHAAVPSPASRPAAHMRLMVVMPVGGVLVIDSNKRLALVFEANGQLRKQQPIEPMPGLTADDVTFSPDGDVAYIFDSNSESLKVISLL